MMGIKGSRPTGWLLVLCFSCVCMTATGISQRYSQSDNDTQVPSLLRWATDNGILAPKLQAQNINGKRGMVTTKKINKGRTLLSIPRSMALVVSQDASSPMPDLLPDQTWKHLPEQHQLACLLLWHAKQGSASPLHPWLEALPRTFNNLAQWTCAELDELQLGSASAEIEFRAQIAQETDAVQQLLEGLRSSNFVDSLKVTQQDLQWALNCVYSRSFAVPAPLEWKKPLYTSLALLLALALFVYSPLKQWQYSEAMSWITAVSLIITLYPAVYFLLYGSSATETESDTAMLPLVDFLNHNIDREGEWLQTSLTGSTFKVVAVPDAYAPGDEAVVSYGKKPNEMFLQYYGFVDTSYKADFYTADLLEYVQQVQGIPADRLTKLVTNPSLLQAVESAPLRTNIHGGLQRNTKQGLRYIASSPEHFQRTLDVGSGRLQRTLDWLEFHTSSTVFTAFDYVRDADERVHEVLYNFCTQTLSSKPTTIKQDRAELKKLRLHDKRDQRKRLAIKFRIGKKLILQSCVKRHSEENRVHRL